MNMRVQPPLPAKIWLLKYVVHTYGEHRVPSTKQRKRKRGKQKEDTRFLLTPSKKNNGAYDCR